MWRRWRLRFWTELANSDSVWPYVLPKVFSHPNTSPKRIKAVTALVCILYTGTLGTRDPVIQKPFLSDGRSWDPRHCNRQA